MNRIIALIDSSSYAQSVCAHAGWVASFGEASLSFLHVLGRRDAACDSADLSGSIGLGSRSALLEELAELDGQKARLVNKRGRAILEDAQACAANMGAVKITPMLRHGELVAAMEELENDADMIVIGKRGEQSHLNMEHLGSNLERVVRSTKKPVLVASREFKPVKRILIAFDGGSSAIKAVEHIASSELFRGLEFLLIQVGSEAKIDCNPIGGAVAALRKAGLDVDSRIVAGQPDKVIAETVEKEDFDMLVMGAYGHTRIWNLIIRSTTTQMIGSCKVPIMLFR